MSPTRRKPLLDVVVVAKIKHLSSHEYPHLWPVQPGCGCADWADWFVDTYTQFVTDPVYVKLKLPSGRTVMTSTPEAFEAATADLFDDKEREDEI